MIFSVTVARMADMPSSRLVLRGWPLTLAAFYAMFAWGGPPLFLFGVDTAWAAQALFAVGALAAAATAAVPTRQVRTAALGLVLAPVLFRAVTLALGEAPSATGVGGPVATGAYVTIFAAIACIHLLTVPLVEDRDR